MDSNNHFKRRNVLKGIGTGVVGTTALSGTAAAATDKSRIEVYWSDYLDNRMDSGCIDRVIDYLNYVLHDSGFDIVKRWSVAVPDNKDTDCQGESDDLFTWWRNSTHTESDNLDALLTHDGRYSGGCAGVGGSNSWKSIKTDMNKLTDPSNLDRPIIGDKAVYGTDNRVGAMAGVLMEIGHNVGMGHKEGIKAIADNCNRNRTTPQIVNTSVSENDCGRSTDHNSLYGTEYTALYSNCAYHGSWWHDNGYSVRSKNKSGVESISC